MLWRFWCANNSMSASWLTERHLSMSVVRCSISSWAKIALEPSTHGQRMTSFRSAQSSLTGKRTYPLRQRTLLGLNFLFEPVQWAFLLEQLDAQPSLLLALGHLTLDSTLVLMPNNTSCHTYRMDTARWTVKGSSLFLERRLQADLVSTAGFCGRVQGSSSLQLLS